MFSALRRFVSKFAKRKPLFVPRTNIQRTKQETQYRWGGKYELEHREWVLTDLKNPKTGKHGPEKRREVNW